jgi:hypothetical protein
MSGRWRTGVDIPGASPADPGHQRVDGGQAPMAHPAAAHARPGVPITGGRGGAGEKHGGERAGDSRSPRERPRRSATGPAPAGRPRSPRLHNVSHHLSGQGQRTGTHSACSRCDSYMKGFQPSRRGTAPDCSRLHISRPGHRRPRPARCRPGRGCPACWADRGVRRGRRHAPAISTQPPQVTHPGSNLAGFSGTTGRS